MTPVKVLKMLARIQASEPEFLDYLEELSKDNYKEMKRGLKTSRDDAIHIGYATCIDSLIDTVKSSTSLVERKEAKHEAPDRL